MTVANSVIKDNASNTVANPARTRSLPLSNSISPQADIVKRKKGRIQSDSSLNPDGEDSKNLRHLQKKSGGSMKFYTIVGDIRETAKRRIR